MKIASIVPIKNSSRAFEGKYSMILAHLASHYIDAAQHKAIGNYTILDNSVYETGNAFNIIQLIEIAKDIRANEIILPDVMGDAEATIQAIKDAIELNTTSVLLSPYKFMGVCQGSTIREFMRCFNWLNTSTYIDTIGIPKIAGQLCLDGRPGLEYIWQKSKKPIHLLGCNKNLDEFKQFEHPEKIRSADTCIPALLSIRSDKANAFEDRPEPTIDLVNESIDEVRYNSIIAQLKKEKLV